MKNLVKTYKNMRSLTEENLRFLVIGSERPYLDYDTVVRFLNQSVPVEQLLRGELND